VPKPKASLYLRFRQPDGKQSSYCRAIFDGKSRLRPFWCLVKGTAEHHPEATYYHRTKRDGKEAWESLGTDPAAAWNKATVGKSVDDCKHELASQESKPEPITLTWDTKWTCQSSWRCSFLRWSFTIFSSESRQLW